jgi:hypothetical protein
MAVEDIPGDLAHRARHGIELGEDVDASAVLGDHLLHALDLAFDPAKPGEVVAVGRECAHVGLLVALTRSIYYTPLWYVKKTLIDIARA